MSTYQWSTTQKYFTCNLVPETTVKVQPFSAHALIMQWPVAQPLTLAATLHLTVARCLCFLESRPAAQWRAHCQSIKYE